MGESVPVHSFEKNAKHSFHKISQNLKKFQTHKVKMGRHYYGRKAAPSRSPKDPKESRCKNVKKCCYRRVYIVQNTELSKNASLSALEVRQNKAYRRQCEKKCLRKPVDNDCFPPPPPHNTTTELMDTYEEELISGESDSAPEGYSDDDCDAFYSCGDDMFLMGGEGQHNVMNSLISLAAPHLDSSPRPAVLAMYPHLTGIPHTHMTDRL